MRHELADWVTVTTARVVLLTLAAISVADAAQPGVPPSAVLAAPITPGNLARLVDYASAASVQQRLMDAIGHQDPQVRAAAARVAFSVGVRAAVPSAAAAPRVRTRPR